MITNIVSLAFTLLAGYVVLEAHRSGRRGLALFAMFWVGYNARHLLGQMW